MKMFKLLGATMLCGIFSASAAAITLNGFEIGPDSLIPAEKIRAGGPPRDGIPSIDKPVFVAADAATDMKPADTVLGLVQNGVAKAYPIAIMNYHEIVNDRFGSERVVVTYCPLCGSGMAYTSMVDGMEATFGVSGLLYNSDVLLYDHQTDSLWSQMLSKAISGPMKGKRLEMLPLEITKWSEWKRQNSDTLVLSRNTGFSRNYDKDPYGGYKDEKGVWFPVENKDPRYHPKERVVGLELDGKFKAYPISELSKAGAEISDTFAGKELTVSFNSRGESAKVFYKDGDEIPTVNSFWFAWYAFHPETAVFEAE